MLVCIFVILLYFYLLYVYSLFQSVSLPDLANKVVHRGSLTRAENLMVRSAKDFYILVYRSPWISLV